MPELVSINATFFVDLLNRMGIKPPPVNGFDLSTVVIPVAIVDSGVSLVAQSTPVVPASIFNGTEQVAPAINTILVDTGQIVTAGTYWVRLILSTNENTNQLKLAFQHRNAANGANIEEYRYYNNQSSVALTVDAQYVMAIAVNERIRVINLVAGSGTNAVMASIQLKQLF